MRGIQNYAKSRSSGAAADEHASECDWPIAAEITAKPQFEIRSIGGGSLFWTSKRLVDITISVIALPIVALIAIVICIANIWFNPGRLFYRQQRMGKGGKPFIAIKFRSMTEVKEIARGPYDGIENHRITRLGMLLRRLRVDEFPQFWNILKGDMSLIGPRPDYYPHAVVYCHDIPGYADRHLVRPGITGLAQVHSGYAECAGSIANKVNDDLRYITTANLKLELQIVKDTVGVICSGFGHK